MSCWRGIAWGTFPDYIAAIGTAGALGVGAAALRGELKARRTALAERIVFWPGDPRVDDPKAPYNRRFRALRVENRSALPAYDVRVSFRSGRTDTTIQTFEVIGPDAGEWVQLPVDLQLVPGGTPASYWLRYRDGTGQTWERSGMSTPAKVG
ncbi:MAG TPA: hypothetical protein VNB24_09075 [Acidimicrobiales bacterium]|nr:hypothetical protein [Acidimicrobiales bacterium]